MFCSMCGKKIEDDSRFCEYCGALQEEMPTPEWVAPDTSERRKRTAQNQSTKQERRSSEPKPERVSRNADHGNGSLNMVIKIVFLVIAAVYALVGVIRLIGSLINFITTIFRFGYMAHPVGVLFISMVSIGLAMVFIATSFVAGMIAVGHAKETAGSLFVAILFCSIGIISVELLRFVVTLITFHTANMSMAGFVMAIIFAVVVAAAAYILLFMNGEPPFVAFSGDEFRACASGIFEVLATVVGEQKAERKQKASDKAEAQAAMRRDAAAMNAGPMPGGNPNMNAGPMPGGNPNMNAGPMPGSNPNMYSDFAAGADIGPAWGTKRLNEHRGLLKLILLGFVTCGIYFWVFIYKLSEDINIACRGDGREASGGLGAYIGYSILTCGAYSTCWQYSLNDRIHDNAKRYGLYIQETGLTILLWSTVGMLLCGVGYFVAMHKVCKNANKICAAYNRANGL